VSDVSQEEAAGSRGGRVVIAVSGFHGTGKSAYARLLAKRLGLRYVSAGMIFRQVARRRNMTLVQLSAEAAKEPSIDKHIDDLQRIEAEKGNVVLDSLLAGWICRDLDAAKICVKADTDIRIGRIASRDGISLREAKETTLKREQIEIDRLKKYYGFDLSDLSIYDLVIDSSHLSIESCVNILEAFVVEWRASKLPK